MYVKLIMFYTAGSKIHLKSDFCSLEGTGEDEIVGKGRMMEASRGETH